VTRTRTEPQLPSTKQLRGLRLYVTLVLVLGVVGAFGALNRFYRQHNPEAPYQVARRMADDPMSVVRHVRINGVDLKIPVPYFFSRIPADGDQDTVLLATLYPNFQPLTETSTELWRKGEWYRSVRWLIQDGSRMITLERQWERFCQR